MLMQQFSAGKYLMTSWENYADFLEKLGVPLLLRLKYFEINLTITIKQIKSKRSNDLYKILMSFNVVGSSLRWALLLWR